jgi:phenylacetate-CoA ligase
MFLERRFACWAGLGAELRGEAIEAFQSRQLRALVHHAYERVPYYRLHFDRAGLKPEHVRGIQDLPRIPLTSRADLQRCDPAETVARGADPQRLVVHRTSGSSGQPLSIRRTAFEDRMLQAYRLKVLFGLGLRLSDRRAAVVTQRLAKPPLYSRLGILRYEEIHCLLPAERILARLRDIRPDVLRGFAGTLSWLAAQMDETDRQAIRPRFVTTDSELLTSDMRQRIQAAFGAQVVDFYDSHEFNMIAWQRPGTSVYQLAVQSVIAEVVQDGLPVTAGEQGEFVGTALHSWAMPFIRFRLGDMVTRGDEPSTLNEIQGRLIDRFVLPDGSTIHPFTLVNPLLHNAPWLLQYQLVQERTDRIRVKLVPMPGAHPTPCAFDAVRKTLTARLGAAVSVEVELTEHIPADASGKFRPYYRA